MQKFFLSRHKRQGARRKRFIIAYASLLLLLLVIHMRSHTHRPQTDEAHARCFRQHYYIITRGREGWRAAAGFFSFSSSLLPPAAVAWPKLFLSRPGSSARQLKKFLRTRDDIPSKRGSSSHNADVFFEAHTHETRIFFAFCWKIILPRQE